MYPLHGARLATAKWDAQDGGHVEGGSMGEPGGGVARERTDVDGVLRG
jgi:hypothetical protein